VTHCQRACRGRGRAARGAAFRSAVPLPANDAASPAAERPAVPRRTKTPFHRIFQIRPETDAADNALQRQK